MMAIDLHLTMQIEESENVSITFNGELFYSGPAPTGVPSLDITFDNFESCAQLHPSPGQPHRLHRHSPTALQIPRN